jgi:hypothetical protein
MENDQLFNFDLDSLFKELLDQEKSQEITKSLTQNKFEERSNLLENLFENKSDLKLSTTFHIILEQDGKSTEIGEVFGKWTLIKWVFSDKGGNSLFLCRCLCGNKQIVRYTRLINEKSTQCKTCQLNQSSLFMKKINEGSQRARCNDMFIGEKFGKRIIINIDPKFDRLQHRLVVCQCQCGLQSYVRYSDLKMGKKQSCRSCVKSNLGKL